MTRAPAARISAIGRAGRAFLPVLLAGAVTACVDPASDRAPLGGGGADTAEIARRLPDAAGGFRRGDTTEHEATRPGFGTGVEYAAPSRSAVASVQIYSRGQARIPEDPASPEIEAELSRSVEELLEAVRGRPGRRLAEERRGTQALGPGAGPGLRCATLRGAYGRTMAVVEQLCFGGAAGRFLKVQITTGERSARGVDSTEFLTAVTASARGLTTPVAGRR
jgi:hypothetical protein